MWLLAWNASAAYVCHGLGAQHFRSCSRADSAGEGLCHWAHQWPGLAATLCMSLDRRLWRLQSVVATAVHAQLGSCFGRGGGGLIYPSLAATTTRQVGIIVHMLWGWGCTGVPLCALLGSFWASRQALPKTYLGSMAQAFALFAAHRSPHACLHMPHPFLLVAAAVIGS